MDFRNATGSRIRQHVSTMNLVIDPKADDFTDCYVPSELSQKENNSGMKFFEENNQTGVQTFWRSYFLIFHKKVAGLETGRFIY